MKIENQVTSVELSNKIHKLGVTTPSIFYREWTGAKESEIEMWDKPEYCPDNVNCYTVAELGEVIPYQIERNGNMYFLEIDRWNSLWLYFYDAGEKGEFAMDDRNYEANEANARAELLIFLIENGLLEIINQSLKELGE